MSIEGHDLGSHSGEREHLTLGNRTDVADPLRENEVWLEIADRLDVDLVDAAILMQRRANRGIDLGTRQPRKIATRSCQSGEMGDARRVVAAVRDTDEPVLESERAHDLRGARQQ